MNAQILGVHGFATIPWDHAGIPDKVWADIEALPNGCWVAPDSTKGRLYGETMVERIAHIHPYDCWAITPTCADMRCCNPAHLCVTMKTVLSTREK